VHPKDPYVGGYFLEIFVSGHVGTIPGNMPAKFEVRTLSRFGADRHTHTDRQCCYAVHWADNQQNTQTDHIFLDLRPNHFHSSRNRHKGDVRGHNADLETNLRNSRTRQHTCK